MTDDLTDGAKGRWVPAPETGIEGGRSWVGEQLWTEAHGLATITVAMGEYLAVQGCLLPDGSRTRVTSAMSEPVVPNQRSGVWRHKNAEGHFVYGRLQVEPAEVRFLPDIALRPDNKRHTSPLRTDLEADAATMDRVKADEGFAQRLYASLCNMTWRKENSEVSHSATWRYNGALVAQLRGKDEQYIDYYASGGENAVDEEVAAELARLGWFPSPEPD